MFTIFGLVETRNKKIVRVAYEMYRRILQSKITNLWLCDAIIDVFVEILRTECLRPLTIIAIFIDY